MPNEPQYLEMVYERGPTCWVVRPKLHTTVGTIEYPEDEDILWIAAESGFTAGFREPPKRPKTFLFRLDVVSRSTAAQRTDFLLKLEERATFHCRKFTDTELMEATKLLSRGPLYEVTVGGQRWFTTMYEAAGFLNHSFVPGQPVGDLVLELVGQKLTLRTITSKETERINQLADDISDNK
jgi:hypothetical protein